MVRPSTTTARAQAAAMLRHAVHAHQHGDLAGASAGYAAILRLVPEHFDALHLSGVIAAVRGDPATAERLIGRALAVNPHSAVALNNRGTALSELGRWDAAVQCFERAIALDPHYAEPHYNLGNAHKQRAQWEAALASYTAALTRRPNHAPAHNNRGIVLAALGRWDEALASYARAIECDPTRAEAHYNRGNALSAQNRWDEAVAAYEATLALQCAHGGALKNRALALYELGRWEDALASCDEALALDPDDVDALDNRGCILLQLRRLEDARASFDRAIARAPDAARARVNRGLGLLLAGRYEQGFADFEWRWRDTRGWVIREKREFGVPLWQGTTPLGGRTILVHGEQGFGDTLQFCRYAPLLAARGATVVLEVPRALATLLTRVPGVAAVVIQGDALPQFDVYCPLMSLPWALRTTLESIPNTVPYLRADPARAAAWRATLGAQRRPRVGLVWSGGFRPLRPELWSVNARRNLPLGKLAAWRDVPVEFFSLQTGENAQAELEALRAQRWEGPPIRDHTALLRDFDDTAALIDQLDLVIAVDTAVVHLAGGLGKPVWILNRYDTCWRWLLDREDSPWYPTARVYRQRSPGDWDELLQRVARDLHAYAPG